MVITFYGRLGVAMVLLALALAPVTGLEAALILLIIGAVILGQAFLMGRIRQRLREVCMAGEPVAE